VGAKKVERPFFSRWYFQYGFPRGGSVPSWTAWWTVRTRRRCVASGRPVTDRGCTRPVGPRYCATYSGFFHVRDRASSLESRRSRVSLGASRRRRRW